ncbi:hypothetical protein ID866_10996 [Astraeus odoratus]|nr:hypothetical protein ID866_10996 [Astraeus odoratus]
MHANKKHHPLSKREFTTRTNKIAGHFMLPNLKSHSLCIGSMLEYLLWGVPFDVFQSQGRWASSAFTLYPPPSFTHPGTFHQIHSPPYPLGGTF